MVNFWSNQSERTTQKAAQVIFTWFLSCRDTFEVFDLLSIVCSCFTAKMMVFLQLFFLCVIASVLAEPEIYFQEKFEGKLWRKFDFQFEVCCMAFTPLLIHITIFLNFFIVIR